MPRGRPRRKLGHTKKEKEAGRKRWQSLEGKAEQIGKKARTCSFAAYLDPTHNVWRVGYHIPEGAQLPNPLAEALSYLQGQAGYNDEPPILQEAPPTMAESPAEPSRYDLRHLNNVMKEQHTTATHEACPASQQDRDQESPLHDGSASCGIMTPTFYSDETDVNIVDNTQDSSSDSAHSADNIMDELADFSIHSSFFELEAPTELVESHEIKSTRLHWIFSTKVRKVAQVLQQRK